MISRRALFGFLAGAPAVAIALPTHASIEWEEPEWDDGLESVGLDPIRIAGCVRWYDTLEGYGFVTPDDGGADMLLHVTCLRAGGYQTAVEGARVDCLALRRPKGMQVFRILSMDDSTALVPRHASSEWEEPEWDDSDRTEGGGVWHVKWFNRVRGSGFVRNHAGEKIRVNKEVIRASGIELSEVRPGRSFVVRWKRDERAKFATSLRRA